MRVSSNNSLKANPESTNKKKEYIQSLITAPVMKLYIVYIFCGSTFSTMSSKKDMVDDLSVPNLG